MDYKLIEIQVDKIYRGTAIETDTGIRDIKFYDCNGNFKPYIAVPAEVKTEFFQMLKRKMDGLG